MSKEQKTYTWEELEEYIANTPRWKKAYYAVCRFFDDLYWGFIHRFHPKHRYHVVHTGLPPGYYDPDSRILAVVFTLTKDFIEYTEDKIVWDDNPVHQDAWKKMSEAVAWWDANPDHHSFCACLDVEKGDELKKHLNNIISVLPLMWY